jgi:branched-chain amino acid transport system substrate-binding protein
MTHFTRRDLGKLAGGLAAASALGTTARAQAGEIVIGSASPLSGVFAFAGVEGFEGGRDCFNAINKAGGIGGRQIRYIAEDSGYKVDQAVAIFQRLTSQHQIPIFFGDSTGFQKAINPELNRRGSMIMAGASFASDINNPTDFPNQYMPGPDYSDQMRILLRHIQRTKAGATIALVHSDTEFGRDPIATANAEATRLGLKIENTVVTQPGSVDVSSDVLKLRRANPDYVIFHGYVLQPIPEFMAQARAAGMTSKFMGTFYSTDTILMNRAGAAADGYMGVSCYDFSADAKGPQVDAIREANPTRPRTHAYYQGWMNAFIAGEVLKRNGTKEMTAANLMAAARSIRDFDTGGLTGTKVTMIRNSFPVGRIYEFRAADKRLVAVSDWITVSPGA